MKKSMNRREWLKTSTQIVAVAAVAPLVFSPLAEAGTLSSKASVSYQDHPSGKDMCSNCTHFFPGPSPTADGTCKVVEGKISPHGYCYAYTPKS
ncbi:iron oxidase [Acidithiobacillus concretivorus]|uniref:Iron oxidase n=1 Tax=Acidithiobacillus concretivorus TaxID=3063952 RepID=A0ABS5ZQJ7_9PROT|nr:iron oxidase [Acidithiobacillus concretivorus]MBU2738453.1 iron oxidase [Acidithiobacillus concretivorus]